jgi:hypothetical protein
MNNTLIGRRVLLKPGHPHAGKVGTVKAVEHMLSDTALRIELDGAYDGECMAFPGDYRLT